jgi:hypothetical protein
MAQPDSHHPVKGHQALVVLPFMRPMHCLYFEFKYLLVVIACCVCYVDQCIV